MAGTGIIVAELATKLSFEAIKVLHTYLQTNSARDISSFTEWGKAYNISAKTIAEIAVAAYKSDADIIHSTNDTIKHLLTLLEKCYTASNSPTDRERVFSIIEQINKLLIETETQSMKMKKARQNFSFGAIGTAMVTGIAVVGVKVVKPMLNKKTIGGATKELAKTIADTIFKNK